MEGILTKNENHGKVEPGASSLRLIVCPHPLSIERGRIDRMVSEGATVAGHLRALGWEAGDYTAIAFIDERLIPCAEWEFAVPRAGQNLTVRAIPLGGGGNDQGKTALRIVSMLAVVIAAFSAPWLAPVGWGLVGSWTGAALSATISIAGTLAVNALIPPSRQLDDGFGAGAANPSFRITGTSNQLVPFGIVPQVLGRHRMFPVYAARPFTEVVGDQTFFRALFTLGLGPLALSDFKLGETPLAQFQDVEMEIRYGYPTDAPLTLFPDDVYEDNLSIQLTQALGFQQRTSQPRARELSLDVTFPEGLGHKEDQGRGSMVNSTVAFTVEYRKVGDVSWIGVDNVAAVAAAGTTSFSGTNNDLTFTAAPAGYAGNQMTIVFYAAAALSVQVYPETGPGPIAVYLINGVTTAAQVKTAIDAVSGGIVTIANAPSNDGTGAINLDGDPAQAVLQLTGGRDYQPSLSVSNNSFSPLTANLRWIVAEPDQQFEVRIRRDSADVNDLYTKTRSYWTTLRTFQTLPPTTLAGQCLIAMRIRSTNQLNGQLDEFNCVAQTICPDWTGTAWLTRPTNNPGSLYRYVLQGPANAKPKADSRLDLTTIQAFAARCSTNGFAFNAVIDSRTTVRQLRQDILAAGRGSFGMRDLLYSVVEDLPQSIPVQTVTPRNAWDLRGTKLFVDLPHARKVRLKNEDKGWADDERIVPLDGYGVTGIDNIRRDAWGNPTSLPEATKFETIDAGVGVTNATQVFVLERYNQAVAVLRSEHWEVSQDIEHLRCTRGDRVDVNFDVLLVGLGSARVKAVATDGGGNATGCTLDEPLVMVSGKTYGAKFRRSDGTQTAGKFITVVGEQTIFTFETAIPSANKPAVGDLAALGEYGQETLACLVRGIRAGQDFSATIALVPYAPGVQTAASGTIPAFESGITIPADTPTPPMPIIKSVLSDETVLVQGIDGVLESRILVTLAYASGFTEPVTEIQLRVRDTGSQLPWRQLSFLPQSAQLSVTGVQDGVTYDLMVRAVGPAGQTSDWTPILNHTVVGKTSPPPDVTGLTFDSDGIRWAYPAPPLDFWGFYIRIRPGASVVWDDAFQLNDVPISDMRYRLLPDGSTRIIMVKAVDVAGNESANAAWILQDAAALVLRNLAQTIDEKALGFPGTYTNCSVGGGNLVADSQTLFWSNDSALTWSNDSALMWTGSYKDMAYTFTVTPPVEWLTGILYLQLGITAQGWTVEYRPGSTALFWANDSASFWSSDGAAFWNSAVPSFVAWPGALELPKRQDYEFRISAVGGQVQGVISLLNVLFDMPDLHEAFTNLAIPLGGTRIPLTKAFHVIKTVLPTVVEDGGSARRIRVLDQSLTGPLLAAVDNVETETTGVAGGAVDGY